MYLLDTCFLSELKKKKPDQRALDAFADFAPSQIFMSVVTIGELAVGVEYLPPSARKQDLLRWLDKLQQRFNRTILPLSLPVMWRWARLTADSRRQGFTLPAFDSLLAATALEHQLTIVTRNVKDFQHTGVNVYSPWEVES